MTLHIGKEFTLGVLVGVAGTLYFTKKGNKKEDTPKYEYKYSFKTKPDEPGEETTTSAEAFFEKAKSIEVDIADLLDRFDDLRDLYEEYF